MRASSGQAIRGSSNGPLGGRREKVVRQGRHRRFGAVQRRRPARSSPPRSAPASPKSRLVPFRSSRSIPDLESLDLLVRTSWGLISASGLVNGGFSPDPWSQWPVVACGVCGRCCSAVILVASTDLDLFFTLGHESVVHPW
jgi:hypothetical protein